MNGDAFHRALHDRLAAIEVLADKPEENADNTLRALWHTAAGEPKSAIAAADSELPPLDADMRARLDALVAEARP